MLLDEFDWEELVLHVREGRVVPVVGRELLTVPGAAGPLLDHQIAAAVAAELRVPTDGLPRPFDLGDLARRYHELRGNAGKLYARVKAVADRLDVPVPPALRKLAEIRDLDLFVGATWDGLLERALDEVRSGGRRETVSVAFSPTAALQDLPPRAGAAVYRILGRASSFPDYALSEEDVLEFLHLLQADARRPQRLFDTLRERRLLFLGCGFPDWLARFFMRTLNGERFSVTPRKGEVVADERVRTDAALAGFLRLYQSSLFAEGDAVTFVDELHRRWLEAGGARAEPPTGAAPPMADGAVFLSYTRENAEVVRRVRDALEAAGIDTWFDERALAPNAGMAWDPEIRAHVMRCTLFLAFVSRETEARAEGYFREEWTLAIERSRRFAPGVPFLVPVSVDGTPETAPRVPPEFRAVQFAALGPGGTPTDAFVARIRECVRLRRAP